jgi:hypothetical protein
VHYQVVRQAYLFCKAFIFFGYKLMVFDEQVVILYEGFALEIQRRHLFPSFLFIILYLVRLRQKVILNSFQKFSMLFSASGGFILVCFLNTSNNKNHKGILPPNPL